MHLTLFVPGLRLPDEIHADTVFDLKAPALSLLSGRGRGETRPAGGLSRLFGHAEPLPAAALRKLGAGGAAPGSWLCLDPVHWRVTREGIALDDPRQLALDEAEATALIAAVQPLFAGWGDISASAPGRWEMALARPLALDTQPLPAAIDRRVDPARPGGADGRKWRRLLAEAQTLLHAHPVNRRRAAQDRPPVNSLWPWGQGSLDNRPAQATAPFDVAWSDDPLVAGLCAAAGLPCLPSPGRFQPAGGRVLAVVDDLERAARRLDALAWRAALLACERDWLAPALAAVRRRECTGLRLIGTRSGDAAEFAWSLTRGDLLRFWRRPRPLAALAA